MVLISKAAADSVVTTNTTRFLKVYWENPVTSGDTLVLNDGSGNEIVTLRCETANQSQVFDFPGSGYVAVGFKLATLASGTAKLYIA
jgi:hypothetical protein